MKTVAVLGAGRVDADVPLQRGKIAGGDWASSVPSWCVFDVRVAVYPGDDLDQRKAEIEACLREAANQDAFLRNAPPQITYNGFLAEGYVLSGDDEATALQAGIEPRLYGGCIYPNRERRRNAHSVYPSSRTGWYRLRSRR